MKKTDSGLVSQVGEVYLRGKLMVVYSSKKYDDEIIDGTGNKVRGDTIYGC